MAFSKKTVQDIDVKNKTVLVRVDYNVLNDKGEITETYRIKATKPTIDYLLKNNCKIILASHAGRPTGKPVAAYSLKHIAKKVSEILGRPVQFAPDCVGPTVESKVKSLKSKDIILLENLRFHAEEETNDPGFAKQLASLAEVFVQDGFGNAHRKHASMDAITKFLPSVAGLLLEKEVSTISNAVKNPKRPLVIIMGGAKISDKIALINKFVEIADDIFIGGAMANTFLKESGSNIGQSIYEAGQSEVVNSYKEQVVLPTQVAVGSSLDAETVRTDKILGEVENGDYILDVDFSDQFTKIEQAGTIIWNGPVGMTELENFRKGSLGVAHAIIKSKGKSIVGGGDTAGFIEQEGLIDKFDLVSTGGGASLELMAGKQLPGVEALLDK